MVENFPFQSTLKYVTHFHPWFGKEIGEEEEDDEEEDEEDKDIKGEDRTKVYLWNGENVNYQKNL